MALGLDHDVLDVGDEHIGSVYVRYGKIFKGNYIGFSFLFNIVRFD
jgi:hypothetical protein